MTKKKVVKSSAKPKPEVRLSKTLSKADRKKALRLVNEEIDGLIEEFSDTLDDDAFLEAMENMQGKALDAQEQRRQDIYDADEQGEDDEDD